jgi:restriction endonuclease S subunit
MDGLLDRYLVRAGDVLFRSRGERNTAVAIDERFGEPALAVLPLMILRPRLGVVTPQYLAWAINQPQAQRQFDVVACGTNMRMVPRASLEQLEIDLPDIETQRKIVAIDVLSERELTLTFLASEKRKELTSRILSERARHLSPVAGNERNAE